MVKLLQCSVKASDRFEDKKLCFEITTPELSIVVLAENAEEMRNWIFTIRQASGRYAAFVLPSLLSLPRDSIDPPSVVQNARRSHVRLLARPG
jgi:hypothetical protein